MRLELTGVRVYISLGLRGSGFNALGLRGLREWVCEAYMGFRGFMTHGGPLSLRAVSSGL